MDPEDIAKILDDLGKALTPYGEKAFAILQKQVVIDAWVNIVGLAAVFLVTFISLLVATWAWRKGGQKEAALKAANNGRYQDSELSPWPETFWIAICVFVVALIVFLIFLFASLGSILTNIFNPEWAAIQKVLNALGDARR